MGDSPRRLEPGTTLGPYHIEQLIGAGGMGEVYRAKDTRLGRSVAVKVLPEAWSVDAQRRSRFEREARAVAALNHPNICTIHDVGHDQACDFLVMELIDGESLAGRLTRGPLPLDQALARGIEIADALDKAHRQGIVHRDFKPGNVMLTAGGTSKTHGTHAKLLDFGLARLVTSEISGDAAGPTNTSPVTDAGAVFGTLQYMAPEQIEGRPADTRADIFAFGAVLYEMLTGRRAFEGNSSAALMAAILRADSPSLLAVQPSFPRALDWIVHTCLAKDPDDRFASMHDIQLQLRRIADATSESHDDAGRPVPGHSQAPARSRLRYLAWIAGGMLLLALSPFALARLRPTVDAPTFALSVVPPGEGQFQTLVVSPNGRWLAFTDTVSRQLWVRSLDSTTDRLLPGTDGAKNPFWAPDSRALGFFSGGQLKTIAIDGGPSKELCKVQDNRGGTWNRSGDIVFAPDLRGPLYRIAAAGGTASPLAPLEGSRQEGSHRWPYFLPDGRHYIYFVRSAVAEHVGIYLGSLDKEPARHLQVASTNGVYASAGSLLFVLDGTLMARPFDARTLAVSGESRPLVQGVGDNPGLNLAKISVSETGILVYGGNERSQPTWFDRTGTRLGTVGPENHYSQMWLAPDDRQLAVDGLPDHLTGANDIVIFDLERSQIPTKLTVDAGSDVKPVWLASGRIAWASNRLGTYDLFQRMADQTGPEERLMQSGDSKYPTDGSSDGRLLLFEAAPPGMNADIWALLLDEPRPACRVLGTEFNERQARFSPDGRWIAYTSDRDGREEVYVTTVPAALQGVQHRPASGQCPAPPGTRVSSAGGTQPLWRRDGAELFYLAADGRLMVVAVTTTPAFQLGVPSALFATRIADRSANWQQYAATGDGKRFLVNTPVRGTREATIVINWAESLKR